MHTLHTLKTKTTTAKQTPFFGKGEAMPFFQPKLTVNTPGDAHEQEADRVADQVMRMREGDAPVVQRMPLIPVVGLQRKCAECGQEAQRKEDEQSKEQEAPVQRMPTASGSAAPPDDEEKVQRKCANCEKEEKEQVQRKETGGGDASGHAAPAIVSDVLSSGGGQSMDGGTRQFMESRFGQDFGQVRIHTDSRAAESAAAIQARAYTSGKNGVFGRGEYQPESEGGRRLLAHELVHVGQQNNLNRQTASPSLAISQAEELPEQNMSVAPNMSVNPPGQNMSVAPNMSVNPPGQNMSVAPNMSVNPSEQNMSVEPNRSSEENKTVAPCTITTRTLAAAPNGAPDSRSKVGVNEQVELIASVFVTWSATGGTLSTTTGKKTIWTAPETASNETIRATPGASIATICEKTFDVVAPNQRVLSKTSNHAYTAGRAGSGFFANINIHPLDVSFARIQVREESVLSTATGYYKSLGWNGISHPQTTNWLPLGANNGGLRDNVGTPPPGSPSPFSTGTFNWPIPQSYKAIGAAGVHIYSTGTHIQQMNDATGTETTSKEGASNNRTP